MAENDLLTTRQQASRRVFWISIGTLAVIGGGVVAYVWRPREKPADENRPIAKLSVSKSLAWIDHDDRPDKPIVRPVE